MKLEKISYIAVSAVVIIALVLLTYISTPLVNNNGSRVKKIYYVDNISPAHRKVINSFNEKFSGQIEVEAIDLSFDKFSTNERKELLARYLRSKSDRIDVFAVDQIWVPRFAKWGISLDKYINPAQRNNLLDKAMESCYYKDTLIAVPSYIDIAVMFYRNDVIRRLPDYPDIEQKLHSSITWDEFIKLGEKLKTSNYFLFPADDYEGLICLFVEMLAARNKELVTRDELKFNSPEGVEILRMLTGFINKQKLSPPEVLSYKENQAYNHFVDKKGVFLRGWPAFMNQKDRTEYSTVPTPHFRGSEQRSIFGGWNLMISKFTSNVPEAVKFINYLTGEEAQRIMFEDGGYLPVNNRLLSDKKFISLHPDLFFYKELMQHGVHRPFLENYTNISDVLSLYLNLALKQQMGAEEALLKAEEKINSGSVLLR